MDLHMSDECAYPPESVKSQVFLHTKCIVAMSLWNDDDAKALAESFGARVLLDKMNLYAELISAIKRFCSDVSIPKTAEVFEETLTPPVASSIETAVV